LKLQRTGLCRVMDLNSREFYFHAQAWPSMWGEMLKRRTVDADGRAREAMARSGVSRI
jgi:hypothetical protein